ncbi:hypothetical protein MRX96_008598 [Rhipicephalus microplus]
MLSSGFVVVSCVGVESAEPADVATASALNSGCIPGLVELVFRCSVVIESVREATSEAAGCFSYSTPFIRGPAQIENTQHGRTEDNVFSGFYCFGNCNGVCGRFAWGNFRTCAIIRRK